MARVRASSPATIGELSRLFAGDGYEQQAEMRQRLGFPPLLPFSARGFGGHGPPLLVGGSGDRVLRIAAETADILRPRHRPDPRPGK